MKNHREPLHDVDFVPWHEDIQVEYEEGAAREIQLHDGSRLVLRKVGRDYDPTDRLNALKVLHAAAEAIEVLTGILYVDSTRQNFIQQLRMVEELEQIMEELR